MSPRDEGLDRLLDLDGFIAEVGGDFWVKIVVRRVPPDAERPHGVSYTLTLHDPAGLRVFGIDNAHRSGSHVGQRAVRQLRAIICIGAGPSGRMRIATLTP